MDNIFCSQKFKTFFNEIKQNFFSVESLFEKVDEVMPTIADDVLLGKIVCELVAPPSAFAPDGTHDSIVIFEHKLGFDESKTPYIKTLETGEHGFATFRVYPMKNACWQEIHIQSIDFLIDNLFILSARSRLMNLMINSSFLDYRTTIPNTNAFMRLCKTLKDNDIIQNYTALYLDIKNFKYINQQAGSEGGDLVLKTYAKTIFDYIKSIENDGLLARFGGDNFSAIIKNENVSKLLEFISHLEIKISLQDREYLFEINTRVGIYSMNRHDKIEDIMNGVSSAINIAKSSNSTDIVTVDAQIMTKFMEEKNISVTFPKALKNKEFVVFYQPKVYLDSYKLCGCEALVRWIKDGKIVPPMKFIPILERDKNICQLDFYVFETVCKNIREWIDMGIEPVRVSVNFSRLHIYNKNWAKDIVDIIKKYDVDTKYIEIELTETLSYQDYDAFMYFLNYMKEYGINTSIDDFGTGYSSLNLLKNINVDIIKIDKSFIDNIIDNDNKNDGIVIKNIVRMVNELSMEVIAEGVENIEQVNFLKDIHCGMAQGYLFDKPLPHEDFQKRLIKDRIYHI